MSFFLPKLKFTFSLIGGKGSSLMDFFINLEIVTNGTTEFKKKNGKRNLIFTSRKKNKEMLKMSYFILYRNA